MQPFISFVFFLILRQPPRSTRTVTLFPYTTLFRSLEDRLANSGARIVITDQGGLAKLAEIRDRLPALENIVSIDGGEALDWQQLLERASDGFLPVDTLANDPALIIYTSGTTGPPKGALHAHRVLLGHLPGVEMPQSFFPQRSEEHTSELQSLMRSSYAA